MSILDREALEQSPLADLHAIASELSIDSFRRMRKAALIDAILDRQSGGAPASEQAASGHGESPGASEEKSAEHEEERSGDEDSPGRRRRWRRGGRGRANGEDEVADGSDSAAPEAEGPREIERELERAERPERGARSERSERSGSRRSSQESSQADAEIVEGVVELLPGGSGFVRVTPPDPSDDDVYISSAQVKRCELVTGDRVTGPRRAPRRSERFASLVRVDTVNGRPASELADSVRFEDRPTGFPSRRFELAGADPALEAIQRHAPIGRGSRVTIFGPGAAGKTDTLRRLAKALAADESLQVWLALIGVRPEELPEWQQADPAPAVSLSFAASSDAQSQGLEGLVEQVRRLVARGADAVILIDTLDGVSPGVARRAMASARNVVDGGSLTMIATSSAPLGGETTVVALDRRAGGSDGPHVDESQTWTIRRELLD